MLNDGKSESQKEGHLRAMWAELMDELREIHLGLKPKRRTGPGVGERLQAAYEKVMAKRAKG
jgi:hypothetical protein